MSFTTDTFARIGGKGIGGLAHTSSARDPANESILSGPITDYDKGTIAESIDNSQYQSINNGVAELVTFDVTEVTGSNQLAYEANFPSGYEAGGGFFGAVDGELMRDSTIAIPKTASSPILDVESDGYNPILKNGGTTIAAGDASDWNWDPRAGVVTAEDAAAGGSDWPPDTIQCVIYTGKTIKDAIDESNILNKSVVIFSPISSEEIPLWLTEDDITILEISSVTNAGTLTFSLEYRNSSDAYGAGTIIPSASIEADIYGQTQAGFANASVPANKWIVLTSSAKGGGITQFTASIKYTLTQE